MTPRTPLRDAPRSAAAALAAGALAAALSLSACPASHATPADAGTDAGTDAGPDAGTDAGVTLGATLTPGRIYTADTMRAAIEMQLSGEPFAQLLGFDLAGFVRTLTTPDQYFDPGTGQVRTEPLAYSLAVESYEYSKQPMNNLSFESGAGLSLIWGPLRGGTDQTAESAAGGFGVRMIQIAYASIAGGRFRKPNLIVTPPPVGNPLNAYGWPGLRPVFAEFKSFNPAIHPSPGTTPACTFNGQAGSVGYGGGGDAGTVPGSFSNYECDYNSLNLPDRDAQVDKTLTPDALGFAAWKQGLWTITYWQTLQDFSGAPIYEVNEADRPSVGILGNAVIGKTKDANGNLIDSTGGVYLGDNPMEGWQGLLMIEEIDNKAALLLGALASSDGAALRGVGRKDAIDYTYDAPLLYFPAAVAVTETAQTSDAAQANRLFAKPTGYAISDKRSSLTGLSGLLGGFGEAFAMTDRNNPQVGGSLPFLVTFDGDPFAQDNGLPDGEDTLHDRALGVLKIALVDLDRLHFDPANKVLVDSATVSGSAVTRGTQVSTVDLATSIVALRTAFRALNGSLVLYSNDTPDALGGPAALDAAKLTGAPYTGTLQARLTALVRAQADFLVAKLLKADGSVANGYDLAAGAADGAPTTLEAEASAVRALLEAYLATSDNRYRTRALDVYADLEARFWMEDARIFRTTAGQSDHLHYTPLRFATLQAALRQYYKLVASAPARQAEGKVLLERLLRLNKLVLNGWDDRNRDGVVQWPAECLGGRLQMGERVLSGELGLPEDLGDRDHDCVPEISLSGMPAALGADLELFRR
jgi:hypothetical protein